MTTVASELAVGPVPRTPAGTPLVGDLVVFPVPYGSGSFPGDWVEVMCGIAGMDFARLVAGHGPVQTDRSYLSRFTVLLESVVERATAGAAAGRSAEQILELLGNAPVVLDFADREAARRALVPFFLRPVVSRTLELADGGSGGC